MKKINVVFGLALMMILFTGCSSPKEVKIVYEHHYYIHVNHNAMNQTGFKPMPMRKQNFKPSSNKFGQSKGIDPRYDHKPGMMPYKKNHKESDFK